MSLTTHSSAQRHRGMMPHGFGGSPLLAHRCEPPLENPHGGRTTAPLWHRPQRPHAARGRPAASLPPARAGAERTRGPQQALSPSQDQA